MESSTKFWLSSLHRFSTNTALQANPVTLPSTWSLAYQLAQVASSETGSCLVPFDRRGFVPLHSFNILQFCGNKYLLSLLKGWLCIGTWLITTDHLINSVYGAYCWSSGRKVTWERVHKVLLSSAVNSTFLLEISTLIPQPTGLVRGCHLSNHNSWSDFSYIEWARGMRC